MASRLLLTLARNSRPSRPVGNFVDIFARPYLFADLLESNREATFVPIGTTLGAKSASGDGRVLVERVEGFARPEQWRRPYGEIVAVEGQLAEAGAIVLKSWLAITPEEQLRRFEARRMTPCKQYKLTEEDWRNRDRRAAYEAAACEMIERTGGESAPWVLVVADKKEWARVKVIKAAVRRTQDALSS